jgi:hypothetical protein
MSTNLVALPSTNVTVSGDDPFAAYARSAGNQRSIVGDLLKFQKGEWCAGQNEEEIDEGTRLVAVMDNLAVGWVKWWGGKPASQEIGLVSEGFRPPGRDSLGDHDESRWELDNQGHRRDPWVRTNYLILKEEDGEQIYTFATSSVGGLGCVADLCSEYAKHRRMKPDQYPIVEIGSRSYKHDTFGKVYVPVLNVVGWTDKASVAGALEAAESTEKEDEDSIPF